MTLVDPDLTDLTEGSTTDLVREAIAEARELTKLEIALARNEAIGELKGMKAASIAFGVAGVAAIFTVVFLLMTIAIATRSWLFTLLVGIFFLAVALIGAAFGLQRMPRQPLGETRHRLETDVNELKEGIA